MITLYHHSRFGLARAAVYYRGQPHLYDEGLDCDPALDRLGVRSVARLKAKAGGVAFLTLADGRDAVLDAPHDVLARFGEGGAVEVVIIAEARVDKLARAKWLAVAEGAPCRLSPPLTLKERILAQATRCFGDMPVTEEDDDDKLCDARSGAVNGSGAMAGGGYLSIEPTRALIACDVDSAGDGNGLVLPAKALATQCNERAVAEVARRLRLSGLAGLVVVDLIGQRHNGDRLRSLFQAALLNEVADVIIAPIGRFGTLEFVRPWGPEPFRSKLATALPHAQNLLEQAARLACHHPGRQLAIRASDAYLSILRPLLAASHDPLTPMLRLQPGDATEVVVL